MDEPHQRFQRLFEAHEPAVRAYCARRLDPGSVDDAVAETFSAAWRKIDHVPTGASELPWLYGVAHRVVQHEWRSHGRRARLRDRSVAAFEVRPLELVEHVREREDRRLVLEAARRLSDADQEILRLTLWEEISPSDAATVLGTSVDAAKQRASRARRRLAEEFRRLSADPAAQSGIIRRSGT